MYGKATHGGKYMGSEARVLGSRGQALLQSNLERAACHLPREMAYDKDLLSGGGRA